MAEIYQLCGYAADNRILTEGIQVSTRVLLCFIIFKWWVLIKTRFLQMTER